MEKEEGLVIQPRKDRYSPDNVYRIYMNIGRHPGAKWVSFKDKETGEVTKGIFLPDWETGGIRVSKGRISFQLMAIPVEGCINTHVIVPAVHSGVDCGLGKCGKKTIDFRKAVLGTMYVSGEVAIKDIRETIEKYARRKYLLKIGRYKKD